MNSKLKLFCDELESYGGVREFVEFIFENHTDVFHEILMHYDLEDDHRHHLSNFDSDEVISQLSEMVENDSIEEFLDLVKENIDEESLIEYIDKKLGY